jgi:hypothetical protein
MTMRMAVAKMDPFLQLIINIINNGTTSELENCLIACQNEIVRVQFSN